MKVLWCEVMTALTLLFHAGEKNSYHILLLFAAVFCCLKLPLIFDIKVQCMEIIFVIAGQFSKAS